MIYVHEEVQGISFGGVQPCDFFRVGKFLMWKLISLMQNGNLSVPYSLKEFPGVSDWSSDLSIVTQLVHIQGRTRTQVLLTTSLAL